MYLLTSPFDPRGLLKGLKDRLEGLRLSQQGLESVKGGWADVWTDVWLDGWTYIILSHFIGRRPPVGTIAIKKG